MTNWGRWTRRRSFCWAESRTLQRCPMSRSLVSSRWPSCRSDHTSPTQKRNVLPARFIYSMPRTFSTSLRLTRCGPCFRRGGRRSTNRWSQAGGSGLRCPDRSNGNLRGASAVHPAIETISRAFPVGPARRRPSRGHERVIECLSTIGVFVAVTFLIVWAVQNQTLIGSRTKYACKSRADPVVNPALLSVMRPPPTPLDEADSG